ncbi:hypothetical protein [Puia sp.]|jgi:hypothetical protein|uniref:hypothetical protein n=1 Tax=Puia sp. TaxID=2045100 RepID=UPI002F40EABD
MSAPAFRHPLHPTAMKYFLFEKYTLSTSLTVTEVRQRLEAHLTPGQNLPFISHKTTRPYIGSLDTNGFVIRRVLAWHNSWQPITNGHFINTPEGTCITIRIHPHIMPLLFMTFWTFVIASVFIGAVFASALLFALFPLSLLIAAHTLILLNFNKESTRTKNFLATLLQNSPVKTLDKE